MTDEPGGAEPPAVASATDGPGPPDSRPATADFEPPWREARRHVAAAWARGGVPARIALAAAGMAAAGLLGAFLFGLWHVVVGGLVQGNWNAAGFGFALSSVTGVLLWVEASIARRLLPPGGSLVGDAEPEALT